MTGTRTWLRWLAVLPAAILAGWIAYFACGVASAAIARVLPESASYFVRLLLYYAPKGAAFVIVGAKVAPHPRPAALALAAAAIALSLVIHILGQRAPGPTNYLHFLAEASGAAIGLAFIYGNERSQRGPEGASRLA